MEFGGFGSGSFKDFLPVCWDMAPSPGCGHTAALPCTRRPVQLPGLLAKSAPESWVRGSRDSQGNCIWVPTTWDGCPAAAAWNTGVPPELAAHAEVESKVSATFYSSVRSSLFCRTAALTVVYLSFIDSNSLCSFSYKVPAVMILPSV